VLLKEQIRQTLRRQFGSLDAFLRRWTGAARKQAIIDALRDQGLPLEVLTQAVPNGDELDAFDLIAHVAFDQPPLSRRERAEQVRKRNYFGQYGDQARAVLEALLDKYADHGIAGIEDPEVLQLPPFDRLGGKSHIRRGVFASPDQFSAALTELERQLIAAAFPNEVANPLSPRRNAFWCQT
jgi:type I restriction enzyme R subunit